jgi:hypothetical protein
MAPRFLAGILMLEYLVMAVLHGLQGDWRRSIYWIAASVLTASAMY